MAKYAFLVGFAVALSGSANPRETKDKWTRIFNKAGVSAEMLDWLERWMATIVHLSEEVGEE